MADVRVEVEGRTLKLSNLDKVLYPQTGTTKGEVLNYYARIGPTLLPLLSHRALTRIRWPNGTAAGQFFEKNLPSGAPDWLSAVTLSGTGSRTGAETVTYPVVDSLAALTYLANLASLELHVHQWRVDDAGEPLPPDRLVIDLDPGPPAGLHECAQVALWVRERLEERGLRTAPVTSGSKGLHLYAALPGDRSAEEVRDLAQEVAQELTREHPELVVWKMTKALRPRKVFLDWSQNTAAKTTITPYSLRGRAAPFVAAPRTWEEVEAGAADPDALVNLTSEQVLARVDRDGDLFAAMLGQS